MECLDSVIRSTLLEVYEEAGPDSLELSSLK